MFWFACYSTLVTDRKYDVMLQIQKREEELETTQKCLAVNTERISILSQHHDDVEHELHHTMVSYI